MLPDVDVDNLHTYLSATLKNSQPSADLKPDVKVKTQWDGKERDTTKTVNFKDRIQAVHLQYEGKYTAITAKIINIFLASPLFQYCYKCDVRLIPDFDRNYGLYIQYKIRRCITQHGQFCKCVNSHRCKGIDHLDQKNRAPQEDITTDHSRTTRISFHKYRSKLV